jgi:hypothetical protein
MCFGGIQMFFKLLFSGFCVLALTLVPVSAAQDTDADETYDRPAECGESTADVVDNPCDRPAECVEQEFHETDSTADVDDVIDNPCDYLNQQVIVQSEVDRVLSDRTFVLETDNQIIGEDYLLVIAGTPGCTVNNLDDESEVEFGSLREGKIAQASGVVRMFNRSELERDFGTLNFGDDLDRYDFDESQPVLVACAPKVAIVEEEEIIIEEPVEEDIYVEDIPEPAPIEPAPPEPEPMPEPELPRTSTGLPVLGLLGMLSMALGFAIRLFR